MVFCLSTKKDFFFGSSSTSAPPTGAEGPQSLGRPLSTWTLMPPYSRQTPRGICDGYKPTPRGGYMHAKGMEGSNVIGQWGRPGPQQCLQCSL